MSNNSPTDCDSIFFDPEDAMILQAVSLGDFLKMPFQEPTEIVPGLLFENQNTVVLVAPGLYNQALVLAIIISQIVAAGGHLPPFGAVSALKTHLLIGVGSRTLVRERLDMMRSRFKMPFVRRRAELNLHVIFRNADRLQSLHLNQRGGQRTLKNSIPDGTKLVVFADANYWLTTKEKNPHDYRPFDGLHADLNKMGIATLSFVQSGRVSAGVLESEFLLDGSTTLVELTKDAGAPSEFGGGFNVVRAKISEHDPIPLRFSFWYTTIDGKLDFGWECRDPADSSDTAKEVEIFERQKRVAEMLALNIPQKNIAAALKVDPATVSRDKAKIKVKERPKPAEPDDFDDGMTKGA